MLLVGRAPRGGAMVIPSRHHVTTAQAACNMQSVRMVSVDRDVRRECHA
jgi:hypothetical protein